VNDFYNAPFKILMMKSLLLILVCLISIFSSYAQTDSIRSEKPTAKQFLKQQIVPLSLITAGSLLNIGNIKEKIHEHTPMTDTKVDEYLPYVPAVEMYLFDALGFEHKNTIFNQTKYLLISEITSITLIHVLKYTIPITRPSGGPHSFPSGHTSLAFVHATVLFHEFKDTEPWIAYSGFAFATATGYLRTTNNLHWLPDVVAGAGIGMLTANVVYWLEPLKKLQLSPKGKKVSFLPLVGYKSFALACTF